MLGNVAGGFFRRSPGIHLAWWHPFLPAAARCPPELSGDAAATSWLARHLPRRRCGRKHLRPSAATLGIVYCLTCLPRRRFSRLCWFSGITGPTFLARRRKPSNFTTFWVCRAADAAGVCLVINSVPSRRRYCHENGETLGSLCLPWLAWLGMRAGRAAILLSPLHLSNFLHLLLFYLNTTLFSLLPSSCHAWSWAPACPWCLQGHGGRLSLPDFFYYRLLLCRREEHRERFLCSKRVPALHAARFFCRGTASAAIAFWRGRRKRRYKNRTRSGCLPSVTSGGSAEQTENCGLYPPASWNGVERTRARVRHDAALRNDGGSAYHVLPAVP